MIYPALASLIFCFHDVGATHTYPVGLRSPQFISLDGLPLASSPRSAVPAAEIVESTEAQLGLSRSALADLLGVTRPTLYAWMRGATMRSLNAVRLFKLKEAASHLTAASGGTLPALWQYQTLPSGKSFADGMRSGDDPIELAKMLAVQWQRHEADAAILATIFGD